MSKCRYHIQIIDGEPRISPADRKTRDDFIAEAKDGCYTVEIKRSKKSKSNQQVKAHWGLLVNTILSHADNEGFDTSALLRWMIRDDIPTGVPICKALLQQVLYMVCPIFDENEKRVTLSDMTPEQASRFFNNCRDFLANRGLYIPEPDPEWKTRKDTYNA